jgi:alpha-L-fucosidase
MKLTATLITAATLATAIPSFAQTPTSSVDPHATETKSQRDARMKWWREARFGMFIHWGIYTVPAGVWDGKKYGNAIDGLGGLGEWIMHDAKIPVATYAGFAPQFNPTLFDADRIVSLAKAAGMKYIVITAKHHDGFAMYPSKVSSYNLHDATPFKRDPLAELAAACKKQGIRFGIYYSQAQDWNAPGGGIWNGAWDPAQKGDLHGYVKTKAAPQVKELLTKYKPAELWWDTPVDMSPEDVKELTAAFPLDPGLIANNRLGNGVPGDIETPEQHIPATGFKNRDWEVCMTMNDTWGYQSFDNNYKSSSSLLRNLIDIASKGGNYLLNIGPDATGTVPAPQVQRLQDIAAWMKANGTSIHGTTASPFRKLPFDGRVTTKGNSLFLQVFTWPENGLTLAGLQTPIKSAKVLATGQKLTVTAAADGILNISKPDQLDAVSTVIELKLAGAPVVVEPENIIAPQTYGDFKLKAEDVELEGDSVQIEGPENNHNIGYWTNANDSVHWNINVPAGNAKAYDVELNYSCEPGSEGSTFEVQVDGVATGVTGTITKTASWSDYQIMKLANPLTLAPGKHSVRLVVLKKGTFGVMNLRGVALVPTAGN